MQSISEILQTIARQRGRSDAPLLAFLPAEGAAGERIAHLPIDNELSQAWVALTGEPFRPHQAHALTALRRGEPVALRAAGADAMMTAYLLLYAALLADPAANALIITPDDLLAQSVWGHIAQINQELPRTLQINALPLAPNRRPDSAAQVVIAGAGALHGRLLRHHDRGWSSFWRRLQFVLLPDLERYPGVAAAHLADLIFRLQRIAAYHGGGQLTMLTLLQDLADARPALDGLLGQPWKLVPADDGPRAPNALAIWRGGGTWRRDITDLATAFQRQGYQVHVVCRPLERALLAPLIGDLPRVTFGPELMPAQLVIAAGFPGHSALRRMQRSGCQAVVLVLGDLPHEQALARQAQLFPVAPATSWPAPPPNAYVLAQHVLCAASELPLTAAEVQAWSVDDIVQRLVGQGQLVDLPDDEVAWKPTEAAGDPYASWSLHSSGGAPMLARGEQGQPIGTIEVELAERWAYPNAALPPGTGGFRIIARDDAAGTLTLRFDSSGRRTYPLRRCTVTIRDTRESRSLAGGRALAWGRVIAEEEIYGYREAASNAAPADIALAGPLSTRWAAPACWFELPPGIQAQGQLIGWSLAAALQTRTLADFTDTTPCYDAGTNRLYLVDTHPGGNGLSAWAYANAEDLLPLAYDIALACRNDPLLESLSRADMDWLLMLLGRQINPPAAPERSQAAEPPARPRPRQVEYIEAPPPAPPALPPAAPPRAPEREVPRRPAPPAPPAPPPADAPPAQPHQRPMPLWDAPKPTSERKPPATPAPAGEPKPPAAPAPAGGERHRPPPPPPAERKPPAPAEEAPADAQALIERLRRQRQQREAQLGLGEPRPPAPRAMRPEAVEQRFSPGDRVFCLPYGDGEVRASRVEQGRELLDVVFPDLGELTIDPAVSLVRKLDDGASAEDDLL